MQIVAYHVPGKPVNAEHVLFMAPPQDATNPETYGCILGYASYDPEADHWAGALSGAPPEEHKDLADRDGLVFAIDGANKTELFEKVSQRWGGAEITV